MNKLVRLRGRRASCAPMVLAAGFLVAGVLVGAVGCGDSLEVKNTNPKGSVGGLILDSVTRAPIEGASVSVIAGATTRGPVTTDAAGSFALKSVPAGDVLIMIDGPAEMGYRSAWIRDTLDTSAGEFPANNTVTLGPIGLINGTDSFTLRVLDLDGRPVSDYTVTMRYFVQYVDFSSGNSAGRGEVVVAATTGADGRATFSGLPAFYAMSPDINSTAVLLLPPVESNGVFSYAGGTQVVSLRAPGDPTPDVILDPNFATSLRIRASTVADLYDPPASSPIATVLPINDVINVAFNLPIQNNATVTIMDELGSPIANQPTVTISDDNLTMSFGNNPLVPGNEYNIYIHAVAAVGEVNVSGDFSGAFFTAGINDEVTVVNVNRDPTNQVVELEFSEPVGIGQGATVSLSGTSCVLFFNFDLNQAGGIGDAPSERGATTCNVTLLSNEPDPPGIVGRSGYTKFWRFTSPQAATVGNLPAGTRFDIVFSRIANATNIVERTDGTPVRDFVAPNDIPINP